VKSLVVKKKDQGQQIFVSRPNGVVK